MLTSPTRPSARIRSARRHRRSTACRSCGRGAGTWLAHHPQVRPQPGRSTLAPEAGLLVAAEGGRRIEVVVGVLPDDAGAQRARNLEGLGALVGPDPGGEPVLRVVRLLDRLGLRPEAENRDYRPEDLLDSDPVSRRDVGEQRRRKPVAMLGQRTLDAATNRALLLTGRDERLDPLQLLGRVDRADIGVLVERVADRATAPSAPTAWRSPRRARSPGSAAASRRNRRGPG